jgi:uncharacterized protein YjbJ (UPF0337 family)
MNTPIEKTTINLPGRADPGQKPQRAQPSPDAPKPGKPIEIPAVRPDPTPWLGSPRQQMQSMPSGDALKGKWQQQVGAAKVMWGKLTHDELLQLDGHEQKLAGLVQERYALSADEAARQTRKFFAKHMS